MDEHKPIPSSSLKDAAVKLLLAIRNLIDYEKELEGITGPLSVAGSAGAKEAVKFFQSLPTPLDSDNEITLEQKRAEIQHKIASQMAANYLEELKREMDSPELARLRAISSELLKTIQRLSEQ